MKLPTLSRRFWVAFTTLAVIGAMFAYYLLVYVHLREEKLRVDKYRALARYGENMINTRQDYNNAIERVWKRGRSIRENWETVYFHPDRDERFKGKQKLLEQAKKKLGKDTTDFLNDKATGERLADSKKDENCCCCGQRKTNGNPSAKPPDQKLSEQDSSQIFWKNNRDAVRDSINKIVQNDLKDVTYNGYMPLSEFDSLEHYNFDRVYFSFKGNRQDRVSVFSILTKDFVYRPEQFDEFFIIKAFDRSFHEHEKTQLISADETFQTFQNRVNLQSVDSFLVREKGLLTSHFGEVKFADTKYELFVHSIKFSEEENWLLCGLLEKTNYNYQVRAVNPLVITGAVLTLLFLIVAMPILKPLIMNEFERLGILNIWLAGFSVAYGSALLFLLIWSAGHTLQANDKVDDDLKRLSGQVKSRFEGELRNIYKHLDLVREKISLPLIDIYNSDYRGTTNLLPSKLLYGNFYKQVVKRRDATVQRLLKDNKIECYPYFNYILWIDSFGSPEITLTAKDVPSDYPMPDLKERRYFSRALNDSLWNVPGEDGNANPSKRFALQSIQSWTNHEPEAGIGVVFDSVGAIRDSAGNSPFKVLAMSTRLSSIMDPALPVGFGFCIIDDTGEVWFHSNTKKNHQENIFLEVEHHGKLTGAVKGRGTTFFSAEYEGERARMYVQPLTDIPLHLVVFHDKDYKRTPVVLTIFFVFALLLALFIVQAVQLLLLFACEYRSQKIKIKSKGFFLKVLRPQKKYAGMYRSSIAAQSTLLAICFVLYCCNYFATIVGFITLPLMLLVFHQIVYKGELKDRTIIFSLASVALILLLNVALFKWLNSDEAWVAAGEQFVFVIVLVGFAFVKLHRRLNRKAAKLQIRIKSTTRNLRGRLRKLRILTPIIVVVTIVRNMVQVYPHHYYTFLILVVIVNSVFPVVFFYKIAHWKENLLWSKYEQLEAREATIAQEQMLNANYDFLHPRPDLLAHTKLLGNYLPEQRKLKQEGTTTRGDKFDSLLFQAWPRLADPVGISSAAAFNKALDGKWTWRKSTEEVEITYKEKNGSGFIDVSYTSPVATFNPLGGSYGPLMFLLVLLSLFLIYRVIRFCAKYIFGMGLIPKFNQPSLEDLKPRLARPCHLYITGLPGSKKYDLKTDSSISFVPLFEQGINDHTYNQRKLAHTQELTMRKDHTIVVVSPVQPNAIIEMYRKWINDDKPANAQSVDDKPDEKGKSKTTEYKIALRQWENLFSDFEVYYLSIKPDKKETFSSEIVDAEMNPCIYLQKLASTNKLKSSTLDEDDFIINVEEIAEPYYNSLWNSFSPDEKLLLFDLARDGFVNLKNQRTLRILMQKGVIVTDEGYVSIMNKSFTSFILNVFRYDEEIKLTHEAQAKGSWHNIRLVLVLVLIGIAIFIALAQEELFGNINAFIVTVTSAFAMFSKFGGLFGSESKSKG